MQRVRVVLDLRELKWKTVAFHPDFLDLFSSFSYLPSSMKIRNPFNIRLNQRMG